MSGTGSQREVAIPVAMPGTGARGLTLVSGEGAWLTDATGARHLDLMGMVAVAVTGHAHPRVVRAVQQQAAKLITCGQAFTHGPRRDLEAALARWMPHHHAFTFVNSGAEAIEAAIKIAVQRTGRQGLAAVQGGFHGRTLGALALTARPAMRKGLEDLLAPVTHVPRDDATALDAALGEHVAAFVVEPLQGEGGIQPLDGAFLRRAAELCRERGITFVADEVQSGIGRTGTFLASEHHDLVPDLVCLAKGIGSGVPLGAVALSREVEPPPPGTLGSTFGGGPLACAAGVATLAALEEDDLLERARWLGERARERLGPLVGGPLRALRGRGAMLGLETRVRAAGIAKALQQRKVLVTTAGPQVVRLLPPLVIEPRDWEEALDVIAEVLQS